MEEEILECLEQKKALFIQYEESTSKMDVCDINDIEKYITERAGLATQIDKLNLEIEACCEVSNNPDLMKDAVGNHGDYTDFPESLRPIYNKSSEIFTVISHIYNMEPQILERMKEEREELLGKIKKGSGTAKIYNYVNNLKPSQHENMFLTEKKI